ncbi:hypothetical protein NC652_015208 [Populus alba x Populus x berolinensis]|nr:hypothetical protein NC652_015208 [Populus alba x Populus x berolinensis]
MVFLPRKSVKTSPRRQPRTGERPPVTGVKAHRPVTVKAKVTVVPSAAALVYQGVEGAVRETEKKTKNIKHNVGTSLLMDVIEIAKVMIRDQWPRILSGTSEGGFWGLVFLQLGVRSMERFPKDLQQEITDGDVVDF